MNKSAVENAILILSGAKTADYNEFAQAKRVAVAGLKELLKMLEGNKNNTQCINERED